MKALTYLYQGVTNSVGDELWQLAILEVIVSEDGERAIWRRAASSEELPRDFIVPSAARRAGRQTADRIGIPFLESIYEGYDAELTPVEILALAQEDA